MAKLIHEIWEVIDDRGQVLPSLLLAGPDGDAMRKLLCEEAAVNNQAPPLCVLRFEAESHYEATTRFYCHYGWGEYASGFAWDHEPYSEERVQRQRL